MSEGKMMNEPIKKDKKKETENIVSAKTIPIPMPKKSGSMSKLVDLFK